ncbi:UDP-N-acetylmuramate dehydrogenase [Litorivicinus lipolyticus]|uniref:UDP-N-acetylmuramate dehydrogenase n=1 Tax=Litorivicinus lipolyticus TaxID=418701 RepID=UPI003B5A9815
MTTLGLPGRARYFCRAENTQTVIQALDWASGEGVRVLILGGGSNCVLTQDFDGLVIQIAIQGRQIQGDRLLFGAGEDWDGAVRYAIDQGFSGLECLALIPGSVGAAPVQNIGAYGVELCQLEPCVQVWDRQHRVLAWIDSEDAGYGYRDSVFKADLDRYVIVQVSLRVSRQAPVMPRYPDLQAELVGVAALTAAAVADAVTRVRQRKLPDPARLGNAGSFFKNPVVDAELAQKLAEQEPNMPQFGQANGVKLSAGWLIDQCGFKGHRVGDVGVSESHALVLVHYGEGSGQDLMALARSIQRSVFERFGVQLEPEPRVI